MRSQRDAADLGTFAGNKTELKWNKKDLASLKTVVELVPTRGAAVQAGACLGVFARFLAEVFDTVYVFEPFSSSFVTMTANAPQENIVRFQAALGDRHEMVEPVCELRGNDGNAKLHVGMAHVGPGRGTVPTLLLDDLLLPRCDLLYLDVEGYELYALRGAELTITKHRPVIACEVNRGIEYFGISKDEVRGYIASLGYEHKTTLRSDEVWVPR